MPVIKILNFIYFFPLFKLVPCYAIARRMKDCVLLLCLAITMTPRVNHVRSSNTLAVVEITITSLLKQIATTSVEKVRLLLLLLFCILSDESR